MQKQGLSHKFTNPKGILSAKTVTYTAILIKVKQVMTDSLS